MSKEFKNMDDLFHSTFADDVTEVPAFVKTNIDKRLGFDRKNQFGWFFLVLFFISIGAISSIYFISESFETDLSSSNNTSNKNQIASVPSSEKNNAVSNSSSEENSIEKSINNNNTNIDSNAVSKNPPFIQSRVNNSSNKNIYNNSDNKSKNQLNIQQNNSISLNPSTSNDADSQPNSNAKTFTTTTVNQNENNSSLVSTENTITNPELENAANNNESIIDNTKKNIIDSTVDFQEENKIKKSDSTLAQQNNSENFSVDTLSENALATTGINIDEPKYNPWLLSLTGGLNLSKSSYSSTTQSEEDLYKNSTNSKPGIETNFEVKYRLNNSLTFGSGLGLTQFVENYNFSKSTYQYDSTLTWTYVYDSLDTTMFPPPIDSSYTTTYDSTSVNLYNQSGQTKGTYASIPLSVGTQIIYNKFRFEFFVAGRFNYLISASGGYILNDAFVPFTKTSNPIFKPWYIDMLLGASVNYNLIGKLYISGTFRYRPPIGQMYQGTTFNRSIQYTHIGLGLSLKL